VQTLNDPDKRATYNALIGLGDASAINPFLDTSFERDQAFVDEIAVSALLPLFCGEKGLLVACSLPQNNNSQQVCSCAADLACSVLGVANVSGNGE
jgi:hypothetical protein